MPLLTALPPWLLVAAILGVIHGSLFHLLFGQRLPELPNAAGFAIVGSIAGGLLGTVIPPAMLAIGETNVISTTVLAWSAVLLGRLLRLC